MRFFAALMACALLWSGIAPAAAQTDDFGLGNFGAPPPKEPKWSTDTDGVGINTPVYNPVSKSYFELRRSHTGSVSVHYQWPQALGLASSSTFKGVKGRLAIVNTRQIHEFLVSTFGWPDSYLPWIGLRYWCGKKVGQWVNGELLQPNVYNNWGPRWHTLGVSPENIEQIACGNPNFPEGGFPPYGGVFYWGKRGNYKWNLTDPGKMNESFFIEYPTGKP